MWYIWNTPNINKRDELDEKYGFYKKSGNVTSLIVFVFLIIAIIYSLLS